MGSLSFLRAYDSKATQDNYLLAIRNFLDANGFMKLQAGAKPTTIEGVEPSSDRYIEAVKAGRSVRDDLNTFFGSLRGRPPKVKKVKLAGMKKYFRSNKERVRVDEDVWDDLRALVRGSRARTMDRPPNMDELRRIVQYLPIQTKALALVAASSGMRLGELLRLKWRHIDFSKDPVQVTVRSLTKMENGENGETKTGENRIVFISHEAAEALKDWQRNRPAYLEVALKRSWRYQKKDDAELVFPFRKSSIYYSWSHALVKAGLAERDEDTNIYVMHIHTLRKFFETNGTKCGSQGGMDARDTVEALSGHEEGVITIYRRFSIEEIGEYYKRAEPYLTVFGNGGAKSVAELRTKNDELEKRVLRLETMLQIALTNLGEKKALNTIECANAAISESERSQGGMVKEKDGEIEELPKLF